MQPDHESIIEIRDLTYTYPGYDTSPVTALHHINLDIVRGEKIVITGPSGSGKSTLLRCINGLIPHSDRKGGVFSGEVTVAGMNTSTHSVPEISRVVGTVFQNPDDQIVTNRVDAEIAFGLEQRGVPPEKIEVKIQEIAEHLGIEHLLARGTSDLSWGEKQKVAIASVLVMQPDVVVMDEPFSGLDQAASSNLAKMLAELNRRLNLTILVAEHRIGLLADLMDRIVVMKCGEILYDGLPAEDLRSTPGPHDVVDLECTIPEKNVQNLTPALELIDVSFTYPCSSTRAMADVSLKIYASQITVVLGANGSGKSTLARHLNGLLKPDAGKILLFGEDMAGIPQKELTRLVGLVSQHADYQLFEENIVKEFSFGPENAGTPAAEIKKRIPEIISSFDLDHIDLKTPLLRLSAGEKQRIAIGSVLIMNTPVIVLDEPTLGLDERLKRRLADVLKKMCLAQHSVVVMTHDLEFASSCADRVVSMDRGKICSDSLECEV